MFRRDCRPGADVSAIEATSGTNSGQAMRGTIAAAGRSPTTYNGRRATPSGPGDFGETRMLPLLLPLNSEIPGGRGGRSGYAYPL